MGKSAPKLGGLNQFQLFESKSTNRVLNLVAWAGISGVNQVYDTRDVAASGGFENSSENNSFRFDNVSMCLGIGFTNDLQWP